MPIVWCATIPNITSHWDMARRLPQINVEARSCDVSLLCLSGISLVEHSQQTFTKIAVSATQEFEKIVTPSNCTVVTVSQKEVLSNRVACWKPKPRCGIWPQTKIRNVQLRSPAPHLWCCTFHVNSCNMQWALILHHVNCKQVRMFAYLHHHFPLGKILHPLASRVFAIYNPWIVLAAIYTVHSEKQETFWLHWTYSVCTIPWEEVFPPFSQADADHKQSHTTEIPQKQQDIWAKTHFSLLRVVITKSYVECFNFMSFPPNELLGMKTLWVTSHYAFSYAECTSADLIELHNELGHAHSRVLMAMA